MAATPAPAAAIELSRFTFKGRLLRVIESDKFKLEYCAPSADGEVLAPCGHLL